MGYRTIEIAWTPRAVSDWATFGASRREAARLWNDLVVRHHRLRRLGWKWPSRMRWLRWTKGRYPGLSAQSAQQISGEFCEAVDSCRQLRKNGQMEARYPWRLHHYRDVVYTNQDARIRDGRLVLPHGKSGTLRIRLPDAVTIPGRLMEVRLAYGVVHLICEMPDEACPQETVIGVDLGVNTLIAATDGHKVILISGRAAKATIQYRNKQLAQHPTAASGQAEGIAPSQAIATAQVPTARPLQAAHPRSVPQGDASGGRGVPRRHVLCGGAVQRRRPAHGQGAGPAGEHGLHPQAHQPTRLQDGWRHRR